MAATTRSSYFKTPAYYWWLIIPFGLFVNFLAWYSPESLKTPFLPVIGPFASQIGLEYPFAVQITNLFALLAHIGEAGYAYQIASKCKMTFFTKLMWTIQTFILGFPSLSLISRHQARNKRR